MKPFLFYLYLVMVLLPIALFSQTQQKAFYIGHSLSDQIPDMVESLAIDHPEVGFDWVYQSIPGSPLRWSWDHGATYTSNPPHYYGYSHTTGGLPNATFTTLVLTESVPRNMGGIAETYQYAKLFFKYAADFNPQTQAYIYEVWHCLQSGTPTGCDYDTNSSKWRQRLTDDLPMWEGVVSYLNTNINPQKPIRLIPGGQGLARLNDEIDLGTIPGLNSIEDLFSDDIHLNNKGKYFIACIHFATLFDKSPVGLTNQLQVWWGGNFENPPSPELALRFQKIAWDVVTKYTNNGNNISEERGETNSKSISISPNPVGDVLSIHSDEVFEQIEIFDLAGKKIESLTPQESNFQMNVSTYSPGIYLLKTSLGGSSGSTQFIKK